MDIIITTLVFVVTLGMLAGLCFGLAWSILHLRRKYIHDSIIPMPADPNGNFMPVADLRDKTVIQVRPGNIIQPVPQSITYSPHTVTHVRQVEAPATAQLPQLAAPTVPGMAVPSFAELLDRGEIGQGNRLLLGYSEGQALAGSWLDLYSAAIGGISGSGKTTTTRFLAAQSALMGAKFVVIDPHANVAEESLAATLEPLRPAFAFDPAVENNEILAALWAARQELEKRLRQGKGQPFIVAVDEFSSLMRRDELAAPLVNLLADIAQQGRKVGIFAMCIGQIWTASATGGSSDLRDSFASSYVHRMKRNQARLLVPTDEARLVERLEAGNALLSKTNGDLVQVAIPHTTAADIRRVAGLLPVIGESRSWPIPRTENQPETNQNRTAFEAKTFTAEDMRIIELFRSGKDVPGIVKEVYNLSGNQGARYQQAAKEVQEAIRRAV